MSVSVLGFEVDGDGPPVCPPELQYFWVLEKFHRLPWPGGYEQQPHAVMKQIEACMFQEIDIYNILKRNARNEQNNVGTGQAPTIKDTIRDWSGGMQDNRDVSWNLP